MYPRSQGGILPPWRMKGNPTEAGFSLSASRETGGRRRYRLGMRPNRRCHSRKCERERNAARIQTAQLDRSMVRRAGSEDGLVCCFPLAVR